MKGVTKHEIKFGACRQHWGDGWSWHIVFGATVWYSRINYLHVNAGVDIGPFTVWVQWNKRRARA